jgi:hypothetical protein
MNNAFLNPETNSSGGEVPPAAPTSDQPQQASRLEHEFHYIVIKKSRPDRFVGEKVGVEYQLAIETCFRDDGAARGRTSEFEPIDHAAVVRLPPGYRLTSTQYEERATKYLQQIQTLITGRDQRFTTEQQMQEVVEVCSRVLHAYRQRRDETLRQRMIDAAKNASGTQLQMMADRLNVTPVEYADDPFKSDAEVEQAPVSRRRA